MAITQFGNNNVRATSINLSTDTINNILIANLGSGANASSITFFRGDGVWVVPSSNSIGNSPPRNVKQGGTVTNAGALSVTAIFNSSTATTAGTASLLQVTDGEYIRYATAATVNNFAGWNTTGTLRLTQLQWQPILTVVMRTDTSITNARYWAGWFSADPTITESPLNSMGFCYSTAVDGTIFWRTYTSNATLTTRTVTTLSVAPSTRYVLQVDATNQASIKFYINNVLVNTHTTTIPVNTTPLDYYCRVTTLTATITAISISKIHYEHQNV